MTIQQLLTILRARWVTMLLIAVVTVASTATALVFIPKQYTATASLLVDVKTPDPIAGVLPGLMTSSYMANQVSVLQSERVALKVIYALKLDDNPAMRARWTADTDSQGNFDSWLADLLRKSLTVTPARESNVIDVSYRASDPNFAATMANAFVTAFTSTTIDMRVQPAKEYSELFVNQTKQLRERVEQAQSKLSAFQKQSGLLATDERIDVETTRLAELSSQLVALQAMTSDSSSRQGVSASNMDRVQDVMNNPVITGMRSEIARTEALNKQMMERYGENHPVLTESRTNLNELKARMDAEVRRIGSSITINTGVLRARESQLRDSIEQQRNKLLKLKEQRDNATMLARDVDAAQKALDEIQIRFNHTNLESQAQQTNLLLLKSATAPGSASSPKVVLNMALSVVLGVMLAFLAAFSLEFLDRRVRVSEDVTALLALPVLGDIPRCEFSGSAGSQSLRLSGLPHKLTKLSGLD
jgi:succinoglycan biosynthesis transport protein ExoP